MPPEIEPTRPNPPAHGSPAPDDSGLEGGPGDNAPIEAAPAAAAPAAPATQTPAPAAAAAPAPIVVNGRSFKNVEELANYTALVEQNVLHRTNPQEGPKKVLIDGKPLDEVMFNDPERYNEWVIQQAEDRAYNKIQKFTTEKDNAQSFWNDFYAKNPDLREQEWVVKSKFNESYPELAKLSVGDAISKLANESRGVVDTIKQKAGITTRELPAGGATTLGATGAAVPKGQQPEIKLSFIDQLQAARKKRA